jgi:hypothetical protein
MGIGMSNTSLRGAPNDTADRLQITMLDGAASFIRTYADAHDLPAAEVVRRGLSLIALVEEMSPQEYLAVVDESAQSVQPVELPWRQRLARRLPSFSGRNIRRSSRKGAHLTPMPAS